VRILSSRFLRQYCWLALVVLGLAFAGPALAFLTGDSVTVTLSSPNGIVGDATPISASDAATVVDPGIEISPGFTTNIGPYLLTDIQQEYIDLQPHRIVIQLLDGAVDGGGHYVTGYASGATLTFSSLNDATGIITGLSANVTGGSVTNLAGLNAGNWITLDNPNQVSVKLDAIQFGDQGGYGYATITIDLFTTPSITKTFGAASVLLGGSTSLTFTVANNDISTLTGIGFTDALPTGLQVATPNGLAGSCGGGTITATQGSSAVQLAGAALASGATCSFSVNVTASLPGLQSNVTGAVTSDETGPGLTASADLLVIAPPSISKSFGTAKLKQGTSSTLAFALTNPNATTALIGMAFTDNLPSGLVVATPNGLSSSCGGSVTAVAGSGSVALSGGTLAAGASCTISVGITGTTAGVKNNTTGNVTAANGGAGNTASATITVIGPPAITKTFGAAAVALNATTSLNFTLTNPNAADALSGVAFTDSLPAGLVVASTPNFSSTCGGTATATAGSSSISLTAGTLAANGSCTLSVNVQATTGGVKNNSVQVTSTEGGTGNTSNASLTIVGPPVITKAFGAPSIPLNGATSLTFTLQNANSATPLTGVGFTDPLPAGLVIATPSGLTGSCGGGTITATQATNVVSLSGATLAASASCTFSVNVIGRSAGMQNNVTGNVTATEGGTGGTALASLTVAAPPSIALAFNPSTIAPNATASLMFTITNPAVNVDALTGVAVSDTLPAGLTVAAGSSSVCGGTLTTTAPTGIVLAGATIAANSQCQFSVTVTGNALAQYTNTTDNVVSTNGGSGNAASATLTVAALTPVPALREGTLALLALLLAFVGLRRLRRRVRLH
jgi:hypothetical protein